MLVQREDALKYQAAAPWASLTPRQDGNTDTKQQTQHLLTASHGYSSMSCFSLPNLSAWLYEDNHSLFIAQTREQGEEGEEGEGSVPEM